MPSISLTDKDIENSSLDFEVWCQTCGTGICNNVSVDEHLHAYNPLRTHVLYIEVCSTCIRKAEDENFNAGVQSNEDEIESLKQTVKELEEQISRMEKE